MALIQVSEVGFPKVIGKVWSEKNICLQSAWLEKSPELGVRAQRSGPGFAITAVLPQAGVFPSLHLVPPLQTIRKLLEINSAPAP